MSDPAKYRSKDEVNEYMERDPVEVTRKKLLDKGFATEEEIAAIEQKVKEIVEDSVQFSENSPFPDGSEIYRDVYAENDYPFIIE
jgi:pyruvate dehydrogenase E1 component alpha subunit